MAWQDPFVAFKEAFDEQQLEIQRLFARVSKLEEMNSEVLTRVRKTGNLPDLLEYRCKAPSPVISQREVATVRSSILSDIVTQQTMGLDKALEHLGLDPDRRTRIVNQIQTNVNSILATQLTTMNSHHLNEGATYPADHSTISPTSAPSIDGSWNTSAAASSGDRSSPLWRPSLETSPLMDQTPRYDPGAGFLQSTSLNPANTILGPDSLGETTAYNHIREKRKLELLRINQRTPTIHPPVGGNDPLSYLQQFTPVTSETTSVPSAQLSRGMPSHTTTEDALAHPISTLRDLAAVSSRAAIPNTTPTINLGSVGTEQLCICGNKLSCPLSPVKQRRLGDNPLVQRGFIRLAAVFRGRFVRQLLATHKVYDLIRTIKDTAKLALSIHVERNASHTLKRAASQNSEAASPQPTTDSDRLADEELVLEARLLTQLRGSLNQLHEIFFSWPLSNQIDLLRISRSLPHRNKRATAHTENLSHGAHVCDATCDKWPQRCATEQRRRWCPVATHGESKDSLEWTGKSNRTEMDKPPMSCGPSSLTKLIDSVRKSWPTSQLKSLSIHSKSDRFNGGATPSTPQRSQQPCARTSNMVRRPVSGPLGKARTNVTDDSQHPVRYRIISSPHPPDSSAFLSSSRRCALQYPPYNHQPVRTTSVDARRIVSTCEEPYAGAPRRINRWGDDEKFQNRNSPFEST